MNIIDKIVSRLSKKEKFRYYDDSPLDAYARMVSFTGESWEHYWGIENVKNK
jgi:hypothetical protein